MPTLLISRMRCSDVIQGISIFDFAATDFRLGLSMFALSTSLIEGHRRSPASEALAVAAPFTNELTKTVLPSEKASTSWCWEGPAGAILQNFATLKFTLSPMRTTS
jgi:hypothetical protein